jgi:Phosphotransferase enzyme family
VTPPTGPAAGVHLPWAEVPGAVRMWAARVGGGEPASTRDLAGGFSPGATTVLECPRGGIFVKAVGSELNADSPVLHRREAVVSGALPLAPEFPRLLDVYDDGDWVALAFEAIDGRPPAYPWKERELRAAVRALDALHECLTPNPVLGGEPAATRLSELFGGWAELAAMARPPGGLDEWSGRNLDRLAMLESGWRGAVAGGTLLHCDVRADNLLVTKGGIVFVDWPHACVGVPVFDLVLWAPSVQLEGGPGPEDLLGLSAPSSVVDRDTLAVLVAALAGFFVSHSLRPPPPGIPTLRAFQAAQGAVAMGWLQRLTGW